MKTALGRIMLTYVALLTGLIAMLIPTYVYIYKRYETQCVEENRLLLTAGMDNLASDLSRLSNLTVALRSETQLKRLCQLKRPVEPKHYYWMEQARVKMGQSLTMFTRTPGLIAEYGAIYENGMVMNTDRCFTRLEDMYGKFLYAEGMEAQQWLALLQAQTAGSVDVKTYTRFDKSTFVGLTQVRRIIGGTDNLFFFIYDVERLMQQMATLEIYNQGVITLMDRNQTVVFRTQDAKRHERYHALRASDASSGFTVQVQIPESFIGKRMQPVLLTMLAGLACLAGVGLCMSLWLSRRSIRPIDDIVQTIAQCTASSKPKAEGEYEFDFIHRAITRLDDDLSQALEALDVRERLFKAGMIERLYNGLMCSREEMELAHSLFAHFPARYCICLFHLLDQHDAINPGLAPGLISIAGYLRARLDCPDLEIHPLRLSNLLAILPLPQNAHAAPADYEQPLRDVCDYMRIHHNTQVVCAVSDVHTGFEAMLDACAQTRAILRLATHELGQAVFMQTNLPCAAQWFPVDFMDSRQFYELLLDAQPQAAEALVYNAFEKTAQMGIQAGRHIEQTYSAFRQVFERIQYEGKTLGLQEDIPLPLCEGETNLGVLRAHILTCSRAVCAAISQVSQQRRSSQGEAVLKYIDTHLNDPHLYARSISDQFQISERYLQNILKQMTGQTFFEHVEDKRMKKAYALLLDTNLPISDVCEACGFLLPNSFYKAFKRKFGFAPSSMREKGSKGATEGTAYVEREAAEGSAL